MRPCRAAWLTLLLAGTLQAQLAPEQRRSDAEAMSPDLQAMQRDDTRNPAMLWVQQGAQLWQQPAGVQQRACASCHGEVQRLRGVAARYPAFDAPSGGRSTWRSASSAVAHSSSRPQPGRSTARNCWLSKPWWRCSRVACP